MPLTYNLAHRDYDNNLIKDNIWKNIALKLQANGTFKILQLQLFYFLLIFHKYY